MLNFNGIKVFKDCSTVNNVHMLVIWCVYFLSFHCWSELAVVGVKCGCLWYSCLFCS